MRVTLLHFDFDILLPKLHIVRRQTEKKILETNHNILFVSRIHAIVAFNRNQLL